MKRERERKRERGRGRERGGRGREREREREGKRERERERERERLPIFGIKQGGQPYSPVLRSIWYGIHHMDGTGGKMAGATFTAGRPTAA